MHIKWQDKVEKMLSHTYRLRSFLFLTKVLFAMNVISLLPSVLEIKKITHYLLIHKTFSSRLKLYIVYLTNRQRFLLSILLKTIEMTS